MPLCEVFCFCEQSGFASGKLNIMGIFSGVRLLEIPTQLAVGFVIRLRFDLADDSTHTLRLRVTHPDGKERWLGLPDVTPEPTGEESFAFPVVQGKLPLVVETFGDYVVTLFVDDTRVAETTLSAEK